MNTENNGSGNGNEQTKTEETDTAKETNHTEGNVDGSKKFETADESKSDQRADKLPEKSNSGHEAKTEAQEREEIGEKKSEE